MYIALIHVLSFDSFLSKIQDDDDDFMDDNSMSEDIFGDSMCDSGMYSITLFSTVQLTRDTKKKKTTMTMCALTLRIGARRKHMKWTM